MLLDDQDRAALLDAVRAFAAGEIAPLAERPETPPDADVVERTVGALTELGVISADADPSIGLWDLLDDPESARLSVDLLTELASASPGIAYAVHVRGLASSLDRVAGVRSPAASVTFESAAGVSGRPTGRAFVGTMLSAEDRAVLDDAWGGRAERLHVGSAGWDALWWLEWSPDHGCQLRRVERGSASVTPQPHGHGLDEVVFQRVSGRADGGPVLGGQLVVDAFTAYSLGLLAISVAAVTRAVSRARAYAHTRVQGGVPIDRHDAVAQLLAGAEHAVATTDALLTDLTARPAGLPRLHATWRARAQTHPLLTAAGSDALQVFGGIGYMRDVGAEKDQRDLNTLRRLGGSPTELTLRCAALDDAEVRVA